jgi:phenylacetyl-CoA:acceptor oxidoreductase subunit 2
VQQQFIGGGAGTGLIVFGALSGASGSVLAALMLAGLALVGLGLVCVSLELGRPLRALNVFRNPWTSWMGREAWTSTLLFPAGLAAAWGVPGLAWVAGALALACLLLVHRCRRPRRPAWRERCSSRCC